MTLFVAADGKPLPAGLCIALLDLPTCPILTHRLTKGDNSKELRKQILSAVDSKLPSLLRFLAHDDDDISQAVFDFTHAYLNLLKEVHRPSHDNGNAIQDVLIVVINKMKYDTDHNFDEEGEDEAMFIDFRKQMKVLFENIAKLDRQLVLSVVRLLVAKTISNWQKMPFEEIELAIYCLYLLGETIPAQHLFNNEENFGALQEMISQVIISGVSCHQHSAVKLQYFETVTRYERFFYAQTQHIGPVLASFLDSRGLRSDTPNICSRTSYLLLRFVKALKNQLVPLVGDVLEQLQPLLVVFPPIPNLKTNLSENDKFYLYEAAATLIVCTNAGDERQSQLMTRLLSPVILIFTATFDKLKSGNVDELQAFECAQELQNLVAYASRASKAFNSPQALKNSGCQACFTEALALFLQSLSIPVHRDVVHNGVRQYLHRMIICLGDDLLPFVPVAVSQLLQDCEVRDIQEFIPLINQIVARFKTQISPFLCEVFMPVVNGIFSILNSPADPADTQAARDRQLLHRSYFLFIATLLNNDVYSVIKSQGRDNVQEVLQTILRGVMDLHDPQSQKICFNIFNCLLSAWGTENELNDFAQFIYGSIVPACFEIPLRPEFDFSDAQTMLVLQEIATTLFTLLNKQERSLVVKQIEIQYFSRVQCPANVLQRYCEALAVAKDAKELKSFLKEFYLQLRQS